MCLVAKRLQCAAKDCQTKFTPRIFTQIYCSQRCRNRMAQRRLTNRIKSSAPSSVAHRMVPSGPVAQTDRASDF